MLYGSKFVAAVTGRFTDDVWIADVLELLAWRQDAMAGPLCRIGSDERQRAKQSSVFVLIFCAMGLAP